MDTLVWIGAALSVVGLIGLVYSILRVVRAKRANLSDDDLRAAVAKVMPINMGALAVSVLGLMLVIVGIFLG